MAVTVAITVNVTVAVAVAIAISVSVDVGVDVAVAVAVQTRFGQKVGHELAYAALVAEARELAQATQAFGDSLFGVCDDVADVNFRVERLRYLLLADGQLLEELLAGAHARHDDVDVLIRLQARER